MIPTEERAILVGVLERAAELAVAGRVAAGYRYLLLGLRRAEALVQEGEPYGPALLRRYQVVEESYARHHSVLWHVGGRTEDGCDASLDW